MLFCMEVCSPNRHLAQPTQSIPQSWEVQALRYLGDLSNNGVDEDVEGLPKRWGIGSEVKGHMGLKHMWA